MESPCWVLYHRPSGLSQPPWSLESHACIGFGHSSHVPAAHCASSFAEQIFSDWTSASRSYCSFFHFFLTSFWVSSNPKNMVWSKNRGSAQFSTTYYWPRRIKKIEAWLSLGRWIHIKRTKDHDHEKVLLNETFNPNKVWLALKKVSDGFDGINID